MKKRTRVNHPKTVRLSANNRPLIAPIYRSVKFTVDPKGAPDTGEEKFFYSRGRNPTTRQLEKLVAELQGRDDAVVVGSGMAAVSTCLLTELSASDHVVLFMESYQPSRKLIRSVLPRFGISHSLLSVHDYEGMAEVFALAETKVVFFEAPTNPMLEVPDLARLCGLAREHSVTTILDNTFAGLHNHGDFPIDYYVHSLTKYANGHGDVMGGAIVADEKKIAAVRSMASLLGPVLDPEAAFQIGRGLRTYFLRFEQQSSSAQVLAQYLDGRPEVEKVYYTGLKDHPGYELARQQMDGSGGVVTLRLAGDARSAQRFIDALELFSTSASLGSTESLVAPVKRYWCHDLTDAELDKCGITDTTVRLSIGLEDVTDLEADLEQAFAAAFEKG